jgi:hypothetical protein
MINYPVVTIGTEYMRMNNLFSYIMCHRKGKRIPL